MRNAQTAAAAAANADNKACGALITITKKKIARLINRRQASPKQGKAAQSASTSRVGVYSFFRVAA